LFASPGRHSQTVLDPVAGAAGDDGAPEVDDPTVVAGAAGELVAIPRLVDVHATSSSAQAIASRVSNTGSSGLGQRQRVDQLATGCGWGSSPYIVSTPAMLT
jgi:hypothetical protein